MSRAIKRKALFVAKRNGNLTATQMTFVQLVNLIPQKLAGVTETEWQFCQLTCPGSESEVQDSCQMLVLPNEERTPEVYALCNAYCAGQCIYLNKNPSRGVRMIVYQNALISSHLTP